MRIKITLYSYLCSIRKSTTAFCSFKFSRPVTIGDCQPPMYRISTVRDDFLLNFSKSGKCLECFFFLCVCVCYGGGGVGDCETNFKRNWLKFGYGSLQKIYYIFLPFNGDDFSL